MIWRPISNCWSTTASTPALLASLMTERIFVPKTPLSFARARSASRFGIGFITCAPSASSARPLSTLRNGTTFLTSHRYAAAPRPSMSRSIVISNRIAPRIRSPLNTGLVTMRLRIW
ncbi:unannotated protein [freshwater metagenome]|uniref:Unannotated protein n=1 Tax=freshwater metagenome TaxID=449393 RepID=A0A6J6TIF9_9ZZZZ